jgi:hypothetical protein
MVEIKLFGTLTTQLKLDEIALCLSAYSVTTHSDDTLSLSADGIDFEMIESCPGEFLLRGNVDDLGGLQLILNVLKDQFKHLQIDLFEEDGRLVKRITLPQVAV